MQRLSPSSAALLQFFLSWVTLAIALFVAYLILPGLCVEGNTFVALALVALLVGLVNALANPLLAQVSFGPMVRTTSVFLFIINAMLLWLATGVVRRLFNIPIFVDSFAWAFLGAVVISVVSEILTMLFARVRAARAASFSTSSLEEPAAPADARTFVRRLFAVLAMIVSLVLFVVNVAGIVGLWAARAPVTNSVVTLLGRVEPVLETANNAVVRVNAELGRARGAVGRVETSVTELGENVVNNQVVLNVISNTVGGPLVRSVIRAGETVIAVNEVVRSVNATIEAINALPFVSAPPLPAGVVTMTERIAAVQAEVVALRDRVTGFKANVVGGAVAEVTDRTARIDALLAEVQSQAADLEAKIRQTRQAVALAKSEMPVWITLAVSLGTLLLVWSAFSQAVVFFYAWSLAGFKPPFPGAPVRFSPDGL